MSQPLAHNPVALHFGALAASGFDALLRERYPQSRFVILTDENVAAHWTEFMVTGFDVLQRAEIIELPAGESSKNLEICHSVWEALSDYEITRNDVIINLGGGVITDLGGFVASTFKRGLRFINIPTTLLAQVDASVGGKTGIDLGPYKNQVGVFVEPDMVFIDPGFLTTLPAEQIWSGYAEMLKHGLIADAAHWHLLRKTNPEQTEHLLPLIEHSVRIKKQIVETDFFEKGPRKILNFGHTVGHAIEGYFLEKGTPVLHGFAVALGMVAESFIAYEKGLLTKQQLHEIGQTLMPVYGKQLPEIPNPQRLLQLMRNDKKNANGEIRFSLLNGIGQCLFDQPVEEGVILKGVGYLAL